jgi:hypothetical protein
VATIASQRLNQLVSEIEAARDDLEDGGYQLAAHLLAMVLLQIRLQRNDVTEMELHEFCRLLEKQLPHEDVATIDRGSLRAPSGRDRSHRASRASHTGSETSNLLKLRLSRT